MTRPRDTTPLPEMPCQELVETVTAYLEGALDATDRRRLEDHLAVCGECRAYVDQIRDVIVATGDAGVHAPPIPPELRDGLCRAFRDWAA
jgi:predicted anti-sigma-YlaC factor YlaD